MFRRNPAADHVAHQDRHQGHGQSRRRGHGIGLGVGQRREQPALLRLERKHRDERQRNDQQRQEQRGPDLGRRLPDHAPALVPARLTTGMVRMPVLQLLVRVLDHDNRGIDHGTDGDRDSAQRHDVGIDTLVAHDQECGQHTQRQ
ncbi:hypothetical protein D9M72_396910 [compost metagenome]